jgi:hypothetical protein
MIAPNSILQNRYHVVRELGRGGMGAVYEAVDSRFGSRVAVKQTLVADPGLRRAFAREAQLLNSLRHRALPVVTDFFDEGDGQFLVMQYIQGEDLAHMLARNGRPFEVAVVIRWAKDLLDALEYLHSRTPPIVHRDIKPQNLKLTPEGDVVLLDFGLAKGSLDHMTRMSTGSIQGYTPMYAPLEQMRGQGTDTRSDIYSLGATLHHLLTGTTPADALARADAMIQGQPDPLPRAHEVNPSVPRALSEVVWRAMALKRDDRFASAAAMREALDGAPPAVQDRTEAEAPAGRARTKTVVETVPKQVRETVVEHARAPGSRRPAAIAGGIAMILAGLGGAAFLAWHLGTSPSDPPVTDSVPSGVSLPLVQSGRHTAFTTPASVFEVATSPQGTVIATVGEDGPVRLWSAEDGRAIRTLAGHTKAGRCVAFGPDDSVASGSDDGRIRIWSKEGGPLATLDGHAGGVFAVAFASDGASLASAGYDGLVKFWTVPDGSRIADARAPSTDDLVVCLHAEHRLVAYLNKKAGAVRVWSAKERRTVAELPLDGADVSCGAFNPSGTTLTLGSRQGRLRYYEISSGRLAGTVDVASSEVTAVAVGSSGTIVSGGANGVVQSFIPSNVGLIRGSTLAEHGAVIVSLAFSQDGATLVSAADDRSVRATVIQTAGAKK